MIKLTFIAALAAVTLTSFVAEPAFAQQKRQPQKHHSTDVSCGAQFGSLRRVFPEQVAGITDEVRVWVTPVCESEDLMRSDGNAVYLRPTIAENEAVVAALKLKDYLPEDVFAVRMMGDDTINLYVHHFD
jgi:hypothetical protein